MCDTLNFSTLDVATDVQAGDELMIVRNGLPMRIDVSLLVSSSDKHYEHTQATAATTWTVNHNLDKFPSIVVIEGGTGTVLQGTPAYTDANNLTITFTSAAAGKAYFN